MGFSEFSKRASAVFARVRESVAATTIRLPNTVARCRTGLARRVGENFVVYIASAKTERVVELKAPTLGYYADPFIREHEGRAYLFCEQFSFLRNKGRLRCIAFDENLRPAASHIIPTGNGHVSFPYLIEHADMLYMIPETREEGGIHLYRCDRFPDAWTRVRTLIPDVDAVDTVAFHHDACWWLITSMGIAGYPDRRYLAIFFADDLVSAAWKPHPANHRIMYNALPYGSGRNAGAVLHANGRLLRPAQHNLKFYGEGIDWMEITTLTKTDYVERPLPKTHPLAQIALQFSMHHMSMSGEFVAWDIRDRVWPKEWNGALQATRAISATRGQTIPDMIADLR